MRTTDRLAEAGIAPSIGSVGDSFDNAMAESIIGLYKAEVINRRDRWDSLEQVEWETMRWVAWFYHDRIYEALGDIPPAEHEANHYRQTTPATMAESTNEHSGIPGRVQPSPPPTRTRAAAHGC